jgi:hypothetical protein
VTDVNHIRRRGRRHVVLRPASLPLVDMFVVKNCEARGRRGHKGVGTIEQSQKRKLCCRY